MQTLRKETFEVYYDGELLKPPRGWNLVDYFRAMPGSNTWAYYQFRNYLTIQFYWKHDKWGA